MISAKELNPHGYETTPEIEANLGLLLERINLVREAWNNPMVVTSGLRSEADQMRINPNAPKSMHTRGAAVDIYDPDKALQRWVMDNMALMEHIGVWMEAFDSTPNWVHFQVLPPHSGHRIFEP